MIVDSIERMEYLSKRVVQVEDETWRAIRSWKETAARPEVFQFPRSFSVRVNQSLERLGEFMPK